MAASPPSTVRGFLVGRPATWSAMSGEDSLEQTHDVDEVVVAAILYVCGCEGLV